MSDQWGNKFVYNMICSLIVIILILIIATPSQTRNRKEFYVCTYNDVQYVLMYFMNEKYILLEANTYDTDNKVEIKTSHIRIEEAPIVMERRKFNEVVKLDY